MLRLASNTMPRETGASSEAKYFNSCSTPFSYKRNACRVRPENGAPNESVTVTGTRTRFVSTRMECAAPLLRGGTARGVTLTRALSTSSEAYDVPARQIHPQVRNSAVRTFEIIPTPNVRNCASRARTGNQAGRSLSRAAGSGAEYQQVQFQCRRRIHFACALHRWPHEYRLSHKCRRRP